MAWFLKGNSRRFFRIDTSVRLFIIPKERNSYGEEVFVNGINYVNKSYDFKSIKLKSNIYKEIGLLKENNKIITAIVDGLIERSEVLINILKKISTGQNVLSDPSYWINKNHYLRKIEAIELVKESSPKSYLIMSAIEEKLLSRIKALLKTVEKSNLKEIYAAHLTQCFEAETIIESMRNNSKLEKVPLARMFIALFDYIEHSISNYESFNHDHLLANSHEYWPFKKVNISACGVSIEDSRLFEQFEYVYIKIYNPEIDDVLVFEGKIITSRFKHEKMTNFTAIEFMFPQAKEQLCLLSYIQLLETKDAMESYNAWNKSRVRALDFK